MKHTVVNRDVAVIYVAVPGAVLCVSGSDGESRLRARSADSVLSLVSVVWSWAQWAQAEQQIRDTKGISKLSLIQLILPSQSSLTNLNSLFVFRENKWLVLSVIEWSNLPYKISCLKGSLKIRLLSLASRWSLGAEMARYNQPQVWVLIMREPETDHQ